MVAEAAMSPVSLLVAAGREVEVLCRAVLLEVMPTP